MTSPRVIILRHEPAGSGLPPHFDLLIEPSSSEADEESRDVPTWRCARRLDRLEVGLDFPASRITPHRRWWLSRALGESVKLAPPKGIARVIARGRLLGQGDVEAIPGGADLLVEWESVRKLENRPDSGPVQIRIESLDDVVTRIGRRASPRTSDGCCCHPGDRTCC